MSARKNEKILHIRGNPRIQLFVRSSLKLEIYLYKMLEVTVELILLIFAFKIINSFSSSINAFTIRLLFDFGSNDI